MAVLSDDLPDPEELTPEWLASPDGQKFTRILRESAARAAAGEFGDLTPELRDAAERLTKAVRAMAALNQAR
jgi:hypothetical protein